MASIITYLLLYNQYLLKQINQLLLAYYKHKYGKIVKPANRRPEKAAVSETAVCPRCGAPHQYIYKNNGSKGQYACKVCRGLFNETKYL